MYKRDWNEGGVTQVLTVGARFPPRCRIRAVLIDESPRRYTAAGETVVVRTRKEIRRTCVRTVQKKEEEWKTFIKKRGWSPPYPPPPRLGGNKINEWWLYGYHRACSTTALHPGPVSVLKRIVDAPKAKNMNTPDDKFKNILHCSLARWNVYTEFVGLYILVTSVRSCKRAIFERIYSAVKRV